jgi:hypothetical protein
LSFIDSSSTIIEETTTYCTSGGRTAKLAYYYISFADIEKQRLTNFMRSVIAQLCNQSKILEAVEKLHQDHQSSDLPLDGLKIALKYALETIESCFIIVDALDECPANDGSREQICELLVEIYNWRIPNLHILATSRKEADIEESLSIIDHLVEVPIQNVEVDADIGIYVKSQIAEDPKFGRWAKED